MTQRAVDYECDGIVLKGLAVLPKAPGNVPGVLVAHDWSGRNDFAVAAAGRLSRLGYAALALDLYGQGKTGETLEQKMKLMGPVREDRALLMRRMQAGLSALTALAEVDSARTGAIGFCFGGLCALDLARSGADVSGVVSFHGLLDPPPKQLRKPIRAKVLALHGYKDPMVPPDQVLAFCKEMDEAGCDWQLHAYGRALHAFTNPQANDEKLGTIYEATTADRAFRSMEDFFADLFG
jgi:dienelactone hydrolase